MKKKIYFSLLVLVGLFTYATWFGKPCNLKADLPKTFAAVKAFLAQPNQTKPEAKQLQMDLMNLRYCIDKQINAPDFTYAPTEHLRPVKAARCMVIDDIASLIQPYNAWLMELEFGKSNETNAVVINAATALLNFTKPDELMVATLKKKAQEKSDGFWPAITLLYEHDLMDDSVRSELKEFVRSQKTLEAKQSAAMCAVSYGFWDDAIPYCQELLSQPFKTNGLIGADGNPVGNQLTMGYRRAFDTLGYIGTNAASILPLLKKRQEEVLNSKGVEPTKPFILGGLYSAIQCLEGTRPVTQGSKSPHCMWCK